MAVAWVGHRRPLRTLGRASRRVRLALVSGGHPRTTEKQRSRMVVLTGEAPEVRHIEGGLEPTKGKYFNLQWRIRLTIPPWVPAEEVTHARRLLKGRILRERREIPKKTTSLEVASFVSKQDRLEGQDRLTWSARCKR
jgi:hypothetical protein